MSSEEFEQKLIRAMTKPLDQLEAENNNYNYALWISLQRTTNDHILYIPEHLPHAE